MELPPGEVTALLHEMAKGNPCAEEQLFPLIYRELRRLASSYMRGERPDHTLQPTALVHEAYLRLVKLHGADWQSRDHFFAVSARIMRRILIDHARMRLRLKRGGKQQHRVPADQVFLFSEQESAEILALHESLLHLAEFDAEQARVVELRFFGGLGVEAVSKIVHTSPDKVRRDWNHARSWLYQEMRVSRHDSRTVGDHQRII